MVLTLRIWSPTCLNNNNTHINGQLGTPTGCARVRHAPVSTDLEEVREEVAAPRRRHLRLDVVVVLHDSVRFSIVGHGGGLSVV